MSESIAAQVKALQRMSVVELHQRWLEVFGKPTRQSDREAMWKRLARALQGVPNEAETVDRVIPRTPGPKKTSARIGRPTAPLRDRRLPPPGSAITRTYRGHDLTVTVLEKGFEYDGQVFRSLSAVAHAVTGTHWNGFLFFGLTTTRKQA